MVRVITLRIGDMVVIKGSLYLVYGYPYTLQPSLMAYPSEPKLRGHFRKVASAMRCEPKDADNAAIKPKR